MIAPEIAEYLNTAISKCTSGVTYSMIVRTRAMIVVKILRVSNLP